MPGVCNYCKVRGHNACDCYKRQNDQRQDQQGYAATEEQLLITTHQSYSMFEPTQDWVIDSGATSHVTPHREWFSSLNLLENPQYMVTRDDTKHEIQQRGNVPMNLKNSKLAGLRNVLYVPTLARNLLSVGQLVDHGL